MVLGTLLFVAGFLGEMILRTRPDNKQYRIAEKRNF